VERLWREMAGPGPDAPRLSPDCREVLARHTWPGNFRQLMGVLKVLLALAEPGETVGPEALPTDVRGTDIWTSDVRGAKPPIGNAGSDAFAASNTSPDAPSLTGDLGSVARAAMDAALKECDGNISRAARRLGIHRSTLHRYLAARGH
jgi:sigma-54 dependent transcriptional regulator, acetoin dehydrogenase operon transcriptional activator AcoR